MRHLYLLANSIQNRIDPSILLDWTEQFFEIESERSYTISIKEYLKMKGLKKEPRHMSELNFMDWWSDVTGFATERDPKNKIYDRIKSNLLFLPLTDKESSSN